MISSLGLGNFKCFRDLQIKVAQLNLLCGLNGVGKSSIIQALLILRQSFLSGDLLEGHLALAGEWADVGTGADVLFEDAQEDILSFRIVRSDAGLEPYSISFDYMREADRLDVRQVRAHRSTSYVPKPWRAVPPFGGVVTYVNAERIGPRKLHGLSTTRARQGDMGAKGEFAINYIRAHGLGPMEPSDPRAAGKSRMADVLDLWLQDIAPGAHLGFEAIQAADALIAGFKFDRPGDVASRRYRATNVGFGLSYVLPILVALVAAPAGALVLIENPEAHVHPRGQTRLGELAARAAAAGVQIVAETHSDHFMDGVRIAVRDGIVKSGDVAFHYFQQDGASAVVTTPTIDADGRLSEWPVGFFDQHEENLMRLLAIPT